MSREGTPTEEVVTSGPTEGPDASITPPPATQSPEPEESPRYDDELHYNGNLLNTVPNNAVYRCILILL